MRYALCHIVFLLSFFPAVALATVTSVSVPANRSELITTAVDMGEVIVADPEVADVFVHGKRHVSVIGKQLGATSVRLFDTDSRLIRAIDVKVTYDLPAIRKTLREFLPLEQIGVKMVNTRLALTGNISSASVANKAIEISEQFLQTRRDSSTQEEEASDPTTITSSTIINLMKVVSGQQVMLRIRVGEVRRSALKELGISLEAIKGSGDVGAILGTGGGVDAFLIDSGLGFGQFNTSNTSRGIASLNYLNSSGNGFAGLIEALERDGIFKTLAEPNLVAISGERAQFLSGGEFPVPVSQEDGEVTVEFKPFGVAVDFTPFVLSENRIRINVRPEVSELSTENAVVVDGLSIPSITTRRADTTIELAPGESFMIAGLIQDTLRSEIEQLPGLSEIPILSTLFRSTNYQRNETELVLAVTPYIVDPVRSTDIKLPTDNFRPASFMESVFYGAIGSISHNEMRFSQTPNLEGPVGFMVD